MIKVPVDTVEDQDVEKIDYIKELNEELKKLSSIGELFICKSYRDDFNPEILKDVKIPIHDSGQECGKVDIGEWISQYLADIEHEGKPQRVFNGKNKPFQRPEFLPIGMTKESGPTDRVEVKLTEEQYKKIAEFEKKHIPSSGPSSSYIGELFRAMQYIEYRAGNDGDCYYTIGTPSFISHLYVMSTLDYINWSWLYDKELELSTPLLNSWIWDNKIHWDGMLFEFEMIKIILIELLENGTIIDRENNTDSRDFTQIKKESRW
jgi:hypothetical protein